MQSFNMAYDDAPMGVMIFGLDKSLAYINAKAESIFGRKYSDFSADHKPLETIQFIDLNKVNIPVETHPVYKSIVQQTPLNEYITGIKNKNTGVLSWLQVSTKVHYRKSKPYYIQVCFIDYTGQFKELQSLKTEVNLLENAQEQSQVGVWEYNLKTRKLHWSRQVYKIFRYENNKPPAFDEYLKMIHPDDVNLLKSAIKKCISKAEKYELRYRICFPTGEQKIIESIGTPVYNWQTKQVDAIQVTVMDITTEVIRDNELKQLALAVESSRNIVIITDVVGRIVWVNHAFTDLTEYELLEVYGKKPGSFLQGEKTNLDTKAEIRQALKNRQPIKTEIYNYSKSGRGYWLELDIQPIYDEKNHLQNFMAIESDITQRKKREFQLQKAKENLKKANETKDRFFSIISHDLRSPISTIKGYLNYIDMANDELSKEDLLEYFKVIKRQTNRTHQLLESMLLWAQTQSGQIQAMPKLIDPDVNIEETLNNLQSVADLKDVEIRFQNKTKRHAFIDPFMLNSVLNNLISNAIKFSHKNSHIDVMLIEKKSGIELSVQDYGVGMNPQTKKLLFKPDRKKSRKGTEGEKGAGLGLILAHDFIKHNNGEILVESAEGKGTKFVVKISFVENFYSNYVLLASTSKELNRIKKLFPVKDIDHICYTFETFDFEKIEDHQAIFMSTEESLDNKDFVMDLVSSNNANVTHLHFLPTQQKLTAVKKSKDKAIDLSDFTQIISQSNYQ